MIWIRVREVASGRRITPLRRIGWLRLRRRLQAVEVIGGALRVGGGEDRPAVALENAQPVAPLDDREF